ncbi:MAG: acyltransferase [Bacteroidia bacterium]|nr:acyltransferase [Bacteroidia bacterium]
MNTTGIYLPGLNALRGFAALLVAVFHFDSMVMHLTFSDNSWFVRNAYLMVDLFFIISGFILFHLYGASFKKQLRKEAYLNFLRARIARIYPLHLFTLLVFVVLIYGSINPYMSGTLTDLIHDPKAIPTHLLLLQSFGFHKIFTWNLPSWSISAEWFSYLLFPLLALFIAKQQSRSLLFLTVFATMVYLAIEYVLPRSKEIWSLPNARDINVTYDYGFLRGLAGFIAGMLTYHLYNRKVLTPLVSRDSAGLFCLIIFFFFMNGEYNDLFYIPVFMTLVLCLASNQEKMLQVCMFKPFQFLGDISYSIYMVHYVLILCVALPSIDLMGYTYTGPGSLHPPLFEGLSVCFVFLLVVAGVSYLSYSFVEKPWRRRINRAGT